MQWCESLADAGGLFPDLPHTHTPARFEPDPYLRICTPLSPHQHLGPESHYHLPFQLHCLQRDPLDDLTPGLADNVRVSPVRVYAQLDECRSAEVDVGWSRRMWRSGDRGGGTFLGFEAQLQNEVLPQPCYVHILSLLAQNLWRGGELARSRDTNAATPPLPHGPFDLAHPFPFGHQVIGGAAALRVQCTALRLRVAHLETPGYVFPVHFGCEAFGVMFDVLTTFPFFPHASFLTPRYFGRDDMFDARTALGADAASVAFAATSELPMLFLYPNLTAQHMRVGGFTRLDARPVGGFTRLDLPDSAVVVDPARRRAR